MKANRLSLIVGLLFLVAGIASIAARLVLQEDKLIAFEKSAWIISYDIEFEGLDSDSKIRIYIPSDTQQYRIVNESFSYDNLAVSFDMAKKQESRKVVGVQRSKKQPSRFTAEIEIQQRKGKEKSEALGSEERAFYLRSSKTIQADHPVFEELGNRLIETKPKEERLAEFAFQHIRSNTSFLPEIHSSDAVSAILDKEADAVGLSRALIALFRSMKIPSRMVTGFILKSGHKASPHHWVEVYQKKRWYAFDPTFGYKWKVPNNYFPLARSTSMILNASGEFDVTEEYSILPTASDSYINFDKKDYRQLFKLERLPIGMRNVVAIVLLLPIGVLITAFFRNLIGLQTFGTFAPALLALSFVMSDWRTGLAILTLVLVVGYLGRYLIDGMKLLMVPRIGLILTLVIMLMTMAISVFDYFNLTPSANAVLLPTVILAMLIERIFITEVEDGTQHVVKLLIGTAIVSFTCFLMLSSELFRILIVGFPEFLFIVVSGLILLGRYSGYRLSELKRFRDFVQ